MRIQLWCMYGLYNRNGTHFLRSSSKYLHRIAIVEPVFAHIWTHKKLDYFTLRGKIEITIQWLLHYMVHNIEKIENFGPGFAVV